MSRAFVKDDDDRPEPTVVSAHAPYYVLDSALAHLDEEKRERAIVVRAVDGTAGFGSRVDVVDERGKRASYAIVNDEEADPGAGAIGITSPLAQALAGAHVGSTVTWHRPVGDATLLVEKIES